MRQRLSLSLLGTLLALLAGCGGLGHTTTADTAITPTVASGARGTISASQLGTRFSATWTIGGLGAGSAHALTINGPEGSCNSVLGRSAILIIALPNVVVNSAGVASGAVHLTMHETVPSKGFFFAVHSHPLAASFAPLVGSGLDLTGVMSGMATPSEDGLKSTSTLQDLLDATTADPIVGCANF